MPLVNEKFLRLLLVIVGVGALAGFGWRVYDYWKHKDEILRPVDVSKLQEKAGGAPRADQGHLKPYPEYAVIDALNVTGKDPPKSVAAEPPKPPPARLSARDLQLTYIQFHAKDHPDNAAWITPADELSAGGNEQSVEVPGDLYQVGQKVRIKSKKDLEVRVAKIEAESVTVSFGKDKDAGELELHMAAFDLPKDAVSSLLGPTKSEAGASEQPLRSTPVETRLNDSGDFEVGSADAAYFQKLSAEEIAAAVPVKPERDRLSNQVRGLRIQSVPENSPFARLGLRADDVVLEVNGVAAVSRDDLLQALRQQQVSVVEVKLERLGAARTIRYRLP